MRKTFAGPLAAVAVLSSVLALGACSNDDDNNNDSTPTPTASATGSASPSPILNTIELVCAEPIGTVQVEVEEGEDDWIPAKVIGSDAVLEPVGFGDIVFTDTRTGQTFTDGAQTKPGADTTGAVDCTFTDDVPPDTELPSGGTVTGSVTVVQHDAQSWVYTPVPTPSASTTP